MQIDLSKLNIRPLAREELDLAVEWAALEGWDPGLNDADVFWQTDSEGFVGAELEGELIATGSIVSYDRRYGFMGFFIVKPEMRGQGIGSKLWFYRRDFLMKRIREGAAIGMDGVFAMQGWYHRGGFEFSHRNLRMQGVGNALKAMPKGIVSLETVPFETVLDYDRKCFGFDREGFLSGWLQMSNAIALGVIQDGQLLGYGVIRKCREGQKIGPLFADSADVAESLFAALGHHAAGEPMWLDIPGINEEAMALAQRHRMQEVFGCARMYLGAAPNLPWNNIFGITTFELG